MTELVERFGTDGACEHALFNALSRLLYRCLGADIGIEPTCRAYEARLGPLQVIRKRWRQGWDSNPRFPAYETGEDGLSSTLQQ